MTIKRRLIAPLGAALEEIKSKENLKISTKYRILKIQDIVKKELEYYGILIEELRERYGGTYNEETKSIQFPDDRVEELGLELTCFENEEIEMPEVYIDLEELESIQLSWDTLEVLMPFIKE